MPDTTTPNNGPTQPVPRGSKSEVARLMQQIEAEVEVRQASLARTSAWCRTT